MGEDGAVLREFKSFILRGNVVDLAVGVAIGGAFTLVVTSFTENLLTPLLAIPGDAASFAEHEATFGGSVFRYGLFVDDVIAFVITAAVLFFVVVRPVNTLMAQRRTEPEVESTTRPCPECMSKILLGARRCAYCTAEVPVAG